MPETRAGLTKAELEYEVRWLLRKLPADPAKLPTFLGDLVVALIDKNNAALAETVGGAARHDDDPDGF
jgi:hypothetical protein